MFRRAPTPPTRALKPPARVDPVKAKGAKWGGRHDELLKDLVELATNDWTVACTDGSAKKVGSWMQAGYGIWFGDAHSHNHRSHVPTHESQSVSRGEL